MTELTSVLVGFVFLSLVYRAVLLSFRLFMFWPLYCLSSVSDYPTLASLNMSYCLYFDFLWSVLLSRLCHLLSIADFLSHLGTFWFYLMSFRIHSLIMSRCRPFHRYSHIWVSRQSVIRSHKINVWCSFCICHWALFAIVCHHLL